MKLVNSRHDILAALRILLGAIFIGGGWLSIRSPAEFADSITGYQLLPEAAVNPLALCLPPFEIMVGLLLALGRPRRASIFCGLTLTGVFAVALTSAILRGLTIDCGCFGHHTPSRLGLWISLGRDLLLAASLTWLYAVEVSKIVRRPQPG